MLTRLFPSKAGVFAATALVVSSLSLAFPNVAHAQGTNAPTTPPAGVSQPSGTTTPTEPLPYVSRTSYRLAPDDQVTIRIINHSDADFTDTVTKDGKINYPHAGLIDVAGKTPSQLEKIVTHVLNGNGLPKSDSDIDNPKYDIPIAKQAYYLHPEVRVYVIAHQARQINLIGTGLKSPAGKMAIKDGWHIFDALAAAGFSTDRPEFYEAQLFRPSPADNSAPPEISKIDLAQVYERNPNPSTKIPGAIGDVELRTDDTIVVNVLDEVQSSVQVIGQVGKPGLVTLPRDHSIATVLNEVQPSPKALLSEAKIQRDGQDIPVDLSRWFRDGKVDTSTELRAGDRVIIPENTRLYSIFGPVSRGGTQVYPDDRKLTLISALSDAGGGTEGVELKDVTVIRPSPTGGTPTLIKRNVKDMINKGELQQDVPIQPGDIIYVPAARRRRGISFGEAIGYVSALPTLIYLLRGHF